MRRVVSSGIKTHSSSTTIIAHQLPFNAFIIRRQLVEEGRTQRKDSTAILSSIRARRKTPSLHTIQYIHIFAHFYSPASGQVVVTGVVPSSPRFLPSNFFAHRVQHSHCSSIFHRVLLTHDFALSASQFVRKKKSPRIYTSMHSAGLELTKLTYLYQARG